MLKLLLASNNPGKLREILDLLGDLPINLITPQQIDLQLEVLEDGDTYVENASKKALAFAQASGLPTLADDSGLEVEALRGAPGLHSARYLPEPGATDADRRGYLLQNLKSLPRPWRARFRCIVALVGPNGSLHSAEGICPGEIIPQERGQDGFGYDPIFLIPEMGRTMAELTMPEKNRISHRARAIQAARPWLIEWIQSEK